jgi:hypothetical protein
MSVTTTSNRISYDGDAVSTVFSFPYKFLATSDLKVYVDDVLQVITTDYTVGTPGDSGANVTFLSPPAVGDGNVVILRDVDLLQSTDLPSNGPFPSVSVETMVDKVTLQVQRIRELLSRAFTLPDSDTSGASTTLPTPTASNVIGWSSDGLSLQNYTTEDFATVAASGNPITNLFSGTGAQLDFTLSAAPVSLPNLEVFISGVRQTPGADYTVSGTTLTFVVAPGVGTDNILARWVTAIASPVTVSDGAITLEKLADGLFTASAAALAKFADGFLAATAAGRAKMADGFVTTEKLLDGLLSADASGRAKMADEYVTLAKLAQAVRAPMGYFYGFAPSTAGSSATMTISAGEAKDSGNAAVITLASSIAKTTSAWAVGTGNGGLDTGAIANNTTYHFYAIRRPDTGVTDVIFSLSASAPTLPANYTQYRYLFPWRTNGSAQWVLMTYSANDDAFLLDTAVLDVSATNPGTSSVTATLASLPTGVKVTALINTKASDTSGAIILYARSLDQSDQAPSATVAPIATSISQSASTSGSSSFNAIRTNTSAQIGYRIQSSAGTTTVLIATLGFIYKMGSR